MAHLTYATINQLRYCEKIGVVKPLKIGNPKKPRILYSPADTLKIELIQVIRSKGTSQIYLNIFDKIIPQINLPQAGHLCLINDQVIFFKDIHAIGLHLCQESKKLAENITFLYLGKLDKIVQDLVERASATPESKRKIENSVLALRR